MTHEPNDFDSWGAEWRAATSEVEVPLTEIHRQVRRFTWLAVANWLVSLALVVGITLLAWIDRRPPVVAGAIAVWGFVAVATLFDLRYRRGTWKAAGDSTEDFVELARRQLVARLRGLRFGWFFLSGEVVFFLFWIPWMISGKPDPSLKHYLLAFGLLAALVAVFSVGMEWMRRRTSGQLERLETVRQGLVELDRAA